METANNINFETGIKIDNKIGSKNYLAYFSEAADFEDGVYDRTEIIFDDGETVCGKVIATGDGAEYEDAITLDRWFWTKTWTWTGKRFPNGIIYIKQSDIEEGAAEITSNYQLTESTYAALEAEDCRRMQESRGREERGLPDWYVPAMDFPFNADDSIPF